MAVKRKTTNAVNLFALVLLIFYAYSTLRLKNVQAAVILRREIDTNVSSELQTAHNTDQLSMSITHDNVTAKSTKLKPQLETLNNNTELPKKTTLKLVNDGPMTITTTNINASKIITTTPAITTTTTAQLNESFMSELKNRVSEKQLDANTNIITTTTMPNTIDTETPPAPTKHLSITLKPVNMLAPVSSATSNTASAVDLSKQNSTNNSQDLIEKTIDLSLVDSVDMQVISSSKSKQPKFLTDNSTNSNQLNLPITADVWTLAGMKNTPMPTRTVNKDNTNIFTNSSTMDTIKEKTLNDWTQIVKMGVDNALTDDTTEIATPFETTEILNETTTPTYAAAISERSDNSPMSKIEAKEFNKNLTNKTLMTLTSTNAAGIITNLSTYDNTDMKTTTTTTIVPTKELILKEKNAFNNKEKEELEISNTTSTLSSSSVATILNTLMTTPAPLEMSSSTPATATVQTTTIRNFELRENYNNTSSGITQVVVEKEATTSQENQVETIEKTTIIETTTTRPSIVLVTNVTAPINLSSTIAQPTPDIIHQISTNKSNLDTPTTTTATIEIAKAIETTQTTSVINILNSSAIANQTKSTVTSASTEQHIANEILTDAANDTAVSVTAVDSLNAQSTSNAEFSLTETTTKAAVTTTIKTKITKETTHNVTTVTPNLEEITLNKNFTTTSSTTTTTTTTTVKPEVPIPKQQQIQFNNTNLNETTTTKTLIDEPKIILITSTVASTEEPKIAFEMTTSSININETSTKFPYTTEPPLINLLDDSTSTSTTIKPASVVISNSTSSPETTNTTTTRLSVFNNTDDLYETFPETTTTTTTSKATVKSTTTTTIAPQTTLNSLEADTTLQQESNTTDYKLIQETTIAEEMIPTTTTPTPTISISTTEFVTAPALPTSATLNPLVFHGDTVGVLQPNQSPKSTPDSRETDVNVVIAISVSVIGVVALILLVAFLYVMRKRQKQTTYGQRCRPVSLDAYSLDNVSVMGSMRKRPARMSKRSYGNAAFQDPALRHNVIQTAADLAEFAKKRTSIFQEFDDVPKVTARAEEIPQGCEDKNRYANVIPLPETRVILQRRNDDDTTEYINANYVRGPSDAPNYYIACQAPLESTVQDFWRMIWEQQSRVIIQATDLIEEGKERCAEYLPPSVTLDNHTTYGDFQVTLKNREVKDKYAISTLLLKNTMDNTSRELTHYWYKWPETGVPTEEAPVIAMLLEARSSLKSYAVEAANELKEKTNGSSNSAETDLKGNTNVTGTSSREINGNLTEKAKNIARHQGPLTIHCSPGTGRTGTIIACDMAIRSLETTKSLDIPQIVYDIRRGRANAVQTKDQYEFIYKVANVYAMKITNVSIDN